MLIEKLGVEYTVEPHSRGINVVSRVDGTCQNPNPAAIEFVASALAARARVDPTNIRSVGLITHKLQEVGDSRSPRNDTFFSQDTSGPPLVLKVNVEDSARSGREQFFGMNALQNAMADRCSSLSAVAAPVMVCGLGSVAVFYERAEGVALHEVTRRRDLAEVRAARSLVGERIKGEVAKIPAYLRPLCNDELGRHTLNGINCSNVFVSDPSAVLEGGDFGVTLIDQVYPTLRTLPLRLGLGLATV